MKRQETITVDLKVAEYCPLKLKQFDTTELTFEIYDNSTRINLENLSAELVFTKSNNKVVIQECEIADGQVIANLQKDCVRLPGESKIEIVLRKNEELVSSFFIPVKIEPSSKENIQSDNTPNYVEILDNAIAQEKERQKNEEERIAAENARKENEEKRAKAEIDRNKAESVRVKAETLRNEEEEKRETAETERTSAETERVSAENARIVNENARIKAFENMEGAVKSEYSYFTKITETTSIITLPAHYKVGANVLEGYGNGEKMIKASDLTGADGHYVEIGEEGSLSNKIQCTNDMEALPGDVFEFIIKGEYKNEEN